MRGENFPNGKIIETAVGNQDEKYWKEILPHREEAEIDWNISVFKDFLVFTEKDIRLGVTRLGIIKFSSNQIEYIKFPEELNVPELGTNSKFDTDKIRVSYSSLTTQDTFLIITSTHQNLILSSRKKSNCTILHCMNPKDSGQIVQTA